MLRIITPPRVTEIADDDVALHICHDSGSIDLFIGNQIVTWLTVEQLGRLRQFLNTPQVQQLEVSQ